MLCEERHISNFTPDGSADANVRITDALKTCSQFTQRSPRKICLFSMGSLRVPQKDEFWNSSCFSCWQACHGG